MKYRIDLRNLKEPNFFRNLNRKMKQEKKNKKDFSN